ncbi:hypothetical protein D3I60_05620 [Brevibacterium permense]|uniref:hypothetical protein n=1 Tax=Brevibacterium permense TaxID=234834 RepID=UPI0021D22D95|nr:hypothetical protein [Brevibacterium permense]MCU4296561.1 hypothetical protein [Brevibacterium permense]
MPVSHRFSRRAAAIGAALALAALPISATFTPAVAQPSPTPTAEAESMAGADASAGADSGDDADSSGTDTGGSDSDPTPPPDQEGDKACKDQEWASDEPCEIEGELTAEWTEDGHQLSVPANDQEKGAGTLPNSWVGKSFQAPEQTMKRIPAQSAAADFADSDTNVSDTDDSGQSVAEATADAAPSQYHFNDHGQIVADGQTEPMDFEEFAPDGPDPKWTFEVEEVDGKNQIVVTDGQPYPDGEGAEASADSDGSTKDGASSGADSGTSDSGPTPTADGSTTSDGSTTDSDTSGDTSAGKDGSSADSETSDDSTTSTDGSTSSDSGSKDRANTSGDKDSDGRESDADSGSGSDGTRGSDSDSSGSGSASGDDDKKDSDKDGSGSTIGAADADGTTPDPSNGNGTPDDERETIPGNAGDEWLPGDDEGTDTPDYSDPVPRNPDEPAPKDDTDLITGGDRPSPRNQNPATSFGESIISTIVSSWPIFVLAASGMAAVGFIIYLMGRRGKQE